jgi:hypothetical protein
MNSMPIEYVNDKLYRCLSKWHRFYRWYCNQSKKGKLVLKFRRLISEVEEAEEKMPFSKYPAASLRLLDIVLV